MMTTTRSSGMVFTAGDIAHLLGRDALQALQQRMALRCTPKQLDAAEELLAAGNFDSERWVDNDAVRPLTAWLAGHGRTRRAFQEHLDSAREANAYMNGGVEDDAGQEASDQRVAHIVQTMYAPGAVKRTRRKITDPEQLARRQEALARARAVRQQNLAARASNVLSADLAAATS